nr:retrovirus-related Pol polyprotein from transposon TNT 1-94 [Tanacetum cinerariifolium]
HDNTAKVSDATVYTFLANQPNGSQPVHEDLEQIHEEYLEEIDVKWQLALLSMRAKRYFQRTGKKITINGSDTVMTRQRNFALTAVLTKSKIVPISTARQSSSRAAAPGNKVRSAVGKQGINVVKYSACCDWIPKIKVQDHASKNSGSYICKRFDYVDPEGRLKHMIGNISYLTDFKEYDRGYVAFGGGAKGGKITGKCTIRTATKDETSRILKSFITEIKNLVEKKVNIIRCDNETELKNRVMNEFCKEKGIKREYSVARTPRQNRVAERRNKTLIEAARTMLADSKLPTTFWAEAVNTACYVQNRVLVVKPHFKIPYKLFKGIFVGYSTISKAFRVYKTRTRKAEENLHITFLENKPMIAGGGPEWLFNVDALSKSMSYAPVPTDEGAEGDYNNLETVISVSPIPSTRIHKDHRKEQIIREVNSAVQTRKMAKQNKARLITFINKQRRTNHKDLQNCLFACFLSQIESKKVTQTLDDESWVEAMQEELLQFKLLNVWTLVDLPHEKRAIGTKWVYRNKRDKSGIVVKNKARLVAQGHRHEEGIDYKEVFAPVARTEAIRLFLAYASFMDFTVFQMDMKSAFLYGTIKEEVYVSSPLGFMDPEFSNRMYKVEKLYMVFIKLLEPGMRLYPPTYWKMNLKRNY